MAIVKKIYDKFIKKYGAEKGKTVYYAWENNNPGIAKKALATARKHKDKIVLGNGRATRKTAKLTKKK
jgi:hypothetical protein